MLLCYNVLRSSFNLQFQVLTVIKKKYSRVKYRKESRLSFRVVKTLILNANTKQRV